MFAFLFFFSWIWGPLALYGAANWAYEAGIVSGDVVGFIIAAMPALVIGWLFAVVKLIDG